MNFKWNKEKCLEYAKKCTTKMEFRTKFPKAYSACWRYKWFDEITWFEPTNYSINYSCKEYVIYSYEISILKSVYVGLTKNIKRRDKQHRNGSKHSNGTINYSSLYTFCYMNKVSIPAYKILNNNLDCKQCQVLEKEWIDYYKSNGWNIINIAPTGLNVSSIGSIPKWNYDMCYEEAKKYDSKTNFKHNSSGAYASACKNGWINDYIWLSKNLNNNTHKKNYWNYETCFEEAKKYNSKKEFEQKSETSFKVAVKNKWLNDYTWFVNPKKNRNYWNYETCFEASKQCKNKKEFSIKYNRAYKLSLQNKWLNKFFNESR